MFIPGVIFGVIFVVSLIMRANLEQKYFYNPNIDANYLWCEDSNVTKCIDDDSSMDKRGYICSDLPWANYDDEQTKFKNCIANDTPDFVAEIQCCDCNGGYAENSVKRNQIMFLQFYSMMFFTISIVPCLLIYRGYIFAIYQILIPINMIYRQMSFN